MSYLVFLLIFIVPVILGLVADLWSHLRKPKLSGGVLFMSLIALIYSTPWDNYLVASGVWSYGTDRVIGVIGYVPIEEHMFFVLQPIFSGLNCFRLFNRKPDLAVIAPNSQIYWRALAAFMVLGLALFFAGILSLQYSHGRYLGLILVWAVPVLMIQWAYGADYVWLQRRTLARAILSPTVYLWFVDAYAIDQHIWQISPAHTWGLQLWGFPLEEAAFFLVTNIMVVQGLALFWYRWGKPL